MNMIIAFFVAETLDCKGGIGHCFCKEDITIAILQIVTSHST
jgi:hypothetical protein